MNVTAHDHLVRESIRATLAAYAVAADAADYETLARCFCPDGTLAVAGGLVLAGRQRIADELGRRARARGHGERNDVFQRHHLGTCHMLVGEGVATATTYYLVVTEIGPDHAGQYKDRLVPHESGWLLASRDASLDWLHPASRFAALVTPPRA